MVARPIPTVWRDFQTDGVPASGFHKPILSDIRDTLGDLFGKLTGANAGALIYISRSALLLNTTAPNAAMAWVIGDPNPENDGVYQYFNGSVWTKRGPLPYTIIQLNNADAGSANAIQVTTAFGIPSAAFGALYILNVTQENTGSVTVAINGGTPKPLLSNTGSPLLAGALSSGMALLCVDDGTNIRLLVPGDIDAIIAAAEAILAAAEAIAGNAFTFPTQADFEAATIPSGVQFVRIAGYYEPGDDGAHTKVRRAGPLTPQPWLTFLGGVPWEMVDTLLKPEKFGAKGDGTTPDHDAVRACFNLCKERGGGRIELGPKTYRLSAGNLGVYDNTEVVGIPFRSTLQLDQGVTQQIFFNPERLTKPLYNFTCTGVVFDQQALGTEAFSVSAVSIEGFDNLTFQFCLFKNTTGYGFGAQASTQNPTYTQPATNLKLLFNIFDNCGFNTGGDPADAIDIKTVAGALIQGNLVTNAADNGINVRGQNVQILDNEVSVCGNSCYSIGTGQGLAMTMHLRGNRADGANVDALQITVVDVDSSQMSMLLIEDFKAEDCGLVSGNGLRIREVNTTTGNLILKMTDITAIRCGFNGINQVIPNIKSLEASGITAIECGNDGIGTSGSGETWTGLQLLDNGRNALRENTGANDNVFASVCAKGSVMSGGFPQDIILVGSRSQVVGRTGDGARAVRFGHANNWVNSLVIEGRQTGGGPRIFPEGPDANIPMPMSTKGSGLWQLFINNFGTEVLRVGNPASGGSSLTPLVNDGTTTSLRALKVGAAGTGPGGTGRAVWCD